jgi:hypothetical protein
MVRVRGRMSHGLNMPEQGRSIVGNPTGFEPQQFTQQGSDNEPSSS